MRGGELAGLRVRDLDRLRNIVQVEDTVHDLDGRLTLRTTKTKKSKGRRVPIPKHVMEQVGEYVDTNRKQPDDFLFSDRAEFFYYQNWSRRHWAPACRKAGSARPTSPARAGRSRSPSSDPTTSGTRDCRCGRLRECRRTSSGSGLARQLHHDDERLCPRQNDLHIETIIERLYADTKESQVEADVIDLRADEA